MLSDYSESATAKAFGLTSGILYLYATYGLLEPECLEGTRYYSESDRMRLAVIRKAMRLGFSIGEVRHLLTNRDRPDQTSKIVEETAPTRAWLIKEAREAVERSRILIANSRRSRVETDEHVAFILPEIERHKERFNS